MVKQLVTPPTPSLAEIRASLPASVFQPNVYTSLRYVAQDILLMLVLFTFAVKVCSALPILWPIYWLLQGTLFWGVFVLGHDCGHGSFSSNKQLNDVCGLFLHSFIMTPYYPWKLSHRHHHKNTNNIDEDEVFYPARKSEVDTDSLSYRLIFQSYFLLGLGWLVYLLKGFYPRSSSHFDTTNPLFVSHRRQVLTSIAGVLSMLILVVQAAFSYGFMFMLNIYVLPLVVFGSWLVVTTFLHHNDPTVSWYGKDRWTAVEGRLASIDRSYWPFDTIIHNIGTHQVHHLFPQIPHYNLVTATRHFRAAFPQLVHSNPTPILTAFVRQFTSFSKSNPIDDRVQHFKYTQ